jgi:hypothetical protein
VLQGVRNRFGIYGVEDQSIDTGITWFLSSIKFFSVNLVACDLNSVDHSLALSSSEVS